MLGIEYNDGLNQYRDKTTELLYEIANRFQVFRQLENGLTFFTSPFTVNATDVPGDMQLELIDLQCDFNLKKKFASVGSDPFYQYLLPGYLRLTTLTAKVLSMLGSTYLYEQAFFVMNLSKTKHLTKSSNTH